MTTRPDAADPLGARSHPTPAQSDIDRRWMRAALALGRRGAGRTWPNPAVGCVIIDPTGPGDGTLLSQGWTQAGGRPHAEAMAISELRARAPERLSGATLYVTLEPCAHHGRTPPCADAIVAAGVARVVFAIDDPDPRVSGRGHATLLDAGLTVLRGVGAAEAQDDLAGHLLRQTEGRPHLTLKLAATLDGRIATASGESQWISGPQARARAHLLRVEADAILVGAGTARDDDPRLDVRLPGLSDASPARAVVDTRLSLPLDSSLAETASTRRLWLLHGPDAPPERAAALTARGAVLIEAPLSPEGRVDIAAALTLLADRGVTRVLCEGGGQLAGSLLRADRVDRLVWAAAGAAIGADGRPAIGPLALSALADAPRFSLTRQTRVGGDVWAEWRRQRPASPP